MKKNPHLEAVAFRIWTYAEPLGWDVSVPDLADALDLPKREIDKALYYKGWARRLKRRRFHHAAQALASEVWVGMQEIRTTHQPTIGDDE